MEYLASLPEEEQINLLQNAMGKTGEYEEQVQQSRTREGLIKRFRKARSRFVRPGGAVAGQIEPDGVQFSLSNTNAKPNLDMRFLKLLKPMIGMELVVGTNHRGRYLLDVREHLVEIGAYGLVDPDLPPHEWQYALAGRFSKGQPIVVFEPYFKVRQDMSEGIRVELAKEMIPWRDVPKDMETWKKLGNEYFGVVTTGNEGSGALACYERAIQAVKEDVGIIAVLLNNIATCQFKIGDYRTATHLSGTAVHLNPTYVKGWFRLATALVEDAGTQGEEKGKHGGRVIAERVIAHLAAHLCKGIYGQAAVVGLRLGSTAFHDCMAKRDRFEENDEDTPKIQELKV
ncbi:hypothetical protein PRIC2_011355 [Phytophthora ramorum]